VLSEEEVKELSNYVTMLPNAPSVLPDVHGIQALSEARTHQPHVVLWDLGLPEGRRRWRPRTTEEEPAAVAIPVMVVTGRDPEVAEQKGQGYGAVALLQKPVKADAVIATIRGVHGQHA
jgi:DNA-binding response OmpR family regulator